MAVYGRVLSELQPRANTVLQRAHEAQRDEIVQRRTREEAAADPLGPDLLRLSTTESAPFDRAIYEAEHRLRRAREEIDEIRDRRRSAEAKAVASLEQAQEQGIESDRWFEKRLKDIGRWIDEHADVLEKISGALKIVSAVAGLLSIVPGLRALFGPIALVGGAAFVGTALLLRFDRHGDGAVPSPSPWPKPDEGSGKWGAEEPSLKDRATRAKWSGIAATADAVGLTNAARHMRHYLSNSGETLEVDPGRIMRDAPGFRREVERRLAEQDPEWRRRALEEFAKNGGKPVRIPVETAWQVYRVTEDESRDWELGLGAFSYKITGFVEVTPSPSGDPGVSMHYQVHVYDYYNWNKGWGVDIPGLGHVSDDELGRLHKVGLAREYEVKGHTPTLKREVGSGGSVEPPVSPDAGGRTDPSRVAS